jgi:guanylate kinase
MLRTIEEEFGEQKKRGILLVLTGPTGAGKDTLFNLLQQEKPSIVKIITTTTRTMRENEKQGDPYYFFPRSEFTDKIKRGIFFEWVEFRGELYGTQIETLMNAIATGNDVVWRIDAHGMRNIKDKVKKDIENSVFVFLSSPFEVLRERVKRDEGDNFSKRWNETLVKWETEQYQECDYLIENKEGELKEAVRNILAIMRSKRLEIEK